VIAHDTGKAINPLTLEGQLHGGYAHGLGYALHEAAIYDADGSYRTASFLDYTIVSTGEVTATPELVQEAHAFIKSLLDRPVLYGGSVKPDNAAELLAQPGVDGVLVGGASLDIDSFVAICEAAARSRS